MTAATYFDGRTAAARPVKVTRAPAAGGVAGLRLITEAGETIDWPPGSFRLASRDAQGVRLETNEPLPRLLVGGADLLALALAAGAAAPRDGVEFPFRRLVLWAVPVLAAGFALFIYGLPLFGAA
ncbi:MAG: hypothetical protein IT162_04490, partial [Bryobacterales bacterium]|nr:hypothetical protein [Bryobacterales bacterium]